MTANVISSYQKGALVRVTGTLRDAAGLVTDPSALIFSCKKPDGSSLSYTFGTDVELVQESQGVFHVDVNADISGTWRYRFAATGAGQSASVGQFRVQPSFED